MAAGFYNMLEATSAGGGAVNSTSTAGKQASGASFTNNNALALQGSVMIRTADCLQNPLEPCGTPWILRETSGTPWSPMEPPRALQNLTEAYRTVQKVTEPYRSAWNIPPGSIRFHYLPSPSMSFPHGTL
jgi:hypothetical protein